MPVIHNRLKKQKQLLRKQNNCCWLCQQPMRNGDITFDHVLPRSKGGGNDFANLQLAHRACNEYRAATMTDVFVDSNGVLAMRWQVRSIGWHNR